MCMGRCLTLNLDPESYSNPTHGYINIHNDVNNSLMIMLRFSLEPCTMHKMLASHPWQALHPRL